MTVRPRLVTAKNTFDLVADGKVIATHGYPDVEPQRSPTATDPAANLQSYEGNAKVYLLRCYNGTLYTRGTLAVITALSLVISDVGLIVSLLGALIGACIIYIFPSLLFLATTKAAARDPAGAPKRLRAERIVARLMVALGACLGALGTSVTLITAFTNLLD